MVKDAPTFRCTNSEVTVQPSPYLSYRLPKDFVDLSTGEDAHKLIDFLKLVKLVCTLDTSRVCFQVNFLIFHFGHIPHSLPFDDWELKGRNY